MLWFRRGEQRTGPSVFFKKKQKQTKMKLKHKTVLIHINTVILSCLSVDGNTFRLLLGYDQGIQHRILERKIAEETVITSQTNTASFQAAVWLKWTRWATQLFTLRSRPQRYATLVLSAFNLGEAPFRAGDMCVCVRARVRVCAPIVLQEVKRDKHVTVHALLVFWKSQVCWWKILNRLMCTHWIHQDVCYPNRLQSANK